MQKVSELFIQNIKNLPIWVKQVIAKEISQDLLTQLNEFKGLIEGESLFQHMTPELSFKGKQELEQKNLNLSEGHYTFLSDLNEGCSIFEITVKNNWALSDTAKIFIRLNELEFLKITECEMNKNIAIASFIGGKIKTGEFLKRIGKINTTQLEQALRHQKELNAEGRHIKMASILIKLGFITDKGLDSLLTLKDEARRRLSVSAGLTSIKYENPQDEQNALYRLQKEVSRLENENIIMRKRLKKLLNINE